MFLYSNGYIATRLSIRHNSHGIISCRFACFLIAGPNACAHDVTTLEMDDTLYDVAARARLVHFHTISLITIAQDPEVAERQPLAWFSNICTAIQRYRLD